MSLYVAYFTTQTDGLTHDIFYSTLIFGATDTTSNALSKTFQLLAEHPDVQDKLRAELRAAGGADHDIPYDALVSLPYMDAICRETLRL